MDEEGGRRKTMKIKIVEVGIDSKLRVGIYFGRKGGVERLVLKKEGYKIGPVR